MKWSPKNLYHLFKTAAMDWMSDHAPRLGASLAFYTIFSLSPLLVLAVTLATWWFKSGNGTDQVFQQLNELVGAKGAEALRSLLVQPESKGSSIWSTIIATGTLLVGSTFVFVQLQDALNAIWEVKQKPGQGVKGFIRNRLLSFAMVFGIGFLLLVSLILTTAVAAAGKYLNSWVGNMEWALQALNFILSIGVVSLLFALMFKILPDAEVSWKDVWFGAIVTAILFAVGKYGIGLYLGKSSVVSSYAAAGSLVIVLLWVYYSAQILFFGAEITQVYARMSGRRVVPSSHAEWDDEKMCESKLADKKKEEKEKAGEKDLTAPNIPPKPSVAFAKKKDKEQKRTVAAVPQYAGAHRGLESGTHSGARGGKRAAWGGAVLLLLALLPIEKKLRHRD